MIHESPTKLRQKLLAVHHGLTTGGLPSITADVILESDRTWYADPLRGRRTATAAAGKGTDQAHGRGVLKTVGESFARSSMYDLGVAHPMSFVLLRRRD